MRFPWRKVVVFAVEALWDAVTGKLERKPPAKGLTHKEVEIQAKASRCAGHESEPKCR